MDITERVAIVETKVETLEKQVNDMDDIKEAVVTLVTIQKERDSRDKDRDEERKKQSEALLEFKYFISSINDNLSGLNTEIRATNSRIDKLETKFYKSEDKNKIDLRDIWKKLAIKFLIGACSIGGFIALLYEVFK